jgi:hypothetical protein
MTGFIRRWWWARQRAIDIRILWPQIKAQTATLGAAHLVFFTHATFDKAWVMEFKDQTWNEIRKLR